MVGPVIPTGADAPHVGAEDQHGEEKKHSGNFKPQGAADLGERAKESAEAAGKWAAGAAGSLAGFAARWSGGGNHLRRWNLAASLGLSGKALAGDAACDAHSDAEDAAYGFGSHPCL